MGDAGGPFVKLEGGCVVRSRRWRGGLQAFFSLFLGEGGAGIGEAGWGSYLWGSEEGRRGFREDSYGATGTHVRHFQLHRVKARFRNGKEVERKRRLLGTRTEGETEHFF